MPTYLSAGYCNVGVGRAFGEPCLPLGVATQSPTFQDLLDEGEGKSLETWTTIFRHLCNRAKDAKAFTPVRGRWTADDVEDQGLANFYTELKTPGRVALDSLNSPKCMRYNDAAMDGVRGALTPVQPPGRCRTRWTNASATSGTPWRWSKGSWACRRRRPLTPRYMEAYRGPTRR